MKSTFDQLIFLSCAGFKIKDVVVKLFCDELIFFKAFVCNIENRVFVGGLIIHIKDDMGFRDRDDIRYVSWFGFNSILANGDMHISCIPLERLHWAERGKMSNRLRLKRVAIVAFKISTHYSIFK
jgi:hypothetical protein